MESILQGISNWFGMLFNAVSSFFTLVGNFIKTVCGIVETLYYGITSLLSGLWNFIIQVFDGDVFNHVGETFNYVSVLIGAPATIFISSFFLLVVIRICIAFVFKFFRFNIDYNNTPKKI